MNRDYETFIKELGELSTKHGISIEGCHCCGSPYLTDAPANETIKYTHDDFAYLVAIKEK